MQALKGWPPPEEESPKRMRRLIRQWLLVPVKWKRHAQQRKACVHAPGGLGSRVAGTGGETVAAVSGVERGGIGGQRLKARGLGRRLFPRTIPRSEGGGRSVPLAG